MAMTRYRLTERGTKEAKRKGTKLLAFASPTSEVLVRMIKQPSRAWTVRELRKAVGIHLMTDRRFEGYYLYPLIESGKIKAIAPQ